MQSHTTFLQDFRHNLHDIGEEVWLYGGHSFRRGAAQWYITNENFNIIMLVNFGGWSTEFDAETIVRYIVGVLDEQTHSRADYLHPYPKKGTPCWYCKRKCRCTSRA